VNSSGDNRTSAARSRRPRKVANAGGNEAGCDLELARLWVRARADHTGPYRGSFPHELQLRVREEESTDASPPSVVALLPVFANCLCFTPPRLDITKIG
jgi:hypothetical protein